MFLLLDALRGKLGYYYLSQYENLPFAFPVRCEMQRRRSLKLSGYSIGGCNCLDPLKHVSVKHTMLVFESRAMPLGLLC
jgi:hypothetical protein